MRKGTAGWTLGKAILSIELATADFVGSIILCLTEDLLGPTVGSGLKPHQGPKQVCLFWNILFNMLPSTPNHAAKMPKEGR